MTEHGYKEATTDAEMIDRWWGTWPNANVGFHPGPSGILVLDLDTYKANYAGVELTFAEKQTVTCITGGGGEHLFFDTKGERYGSMGKQVDGYDIKGWGGHVVLPPSAHLSGNRYTWEMGYAPWEHGLAAVPGAVAELYRQRAERKSAVGSNGNGHSFDAGREFDRAREALERLAVWRADDYDNWMRVGMALAELGDMGFDLWDEWSKGSAKYKEGITWAKWKTFKPGQGITLATLHHLASLDSPVVVSARPSKNGAKAEEAPQPEQKVSLTTRDVLDYFGKNEVGDAEMMAAMYKGRIVYDHAASAWHVWNEHHWLRDEQGMVDNIPTQVLSVIYMDTAHELAKTAETEKEKERVKELYKRAWLLNARARRNNVVDLATTHPDLAIAGSEWDAHPWLLAVKNGVVDLERGTLRPGQPADYMRIVAPVEWKGIDAPAPRWEQFLTEIFDGDDELIAFLQRLLGYAITGFSTEHVLPILCGKSGFNGKDTLLKALAYTLGSGYADTVPEDVFIDMGKSGGANAQPHVYRLRGLRLAWTSETEEGARLKSGQVKMISGGGILTARPLYGSPVSWQATHTVLLITNHRPHVNDDSALWKRILPIDFTMSFVDEPKEPNERQRDANLDPKLWAEASGILAWLVRGCLAWQRDGLNPPDSVKMATKSYRTDEDTLGKWIDENCIVGPLYRFKAGTAYENYAAWCKTLNHHPLNGTNFGRKLTERYPKERTSTGINYVGIGLLTEQTT